MAYEYLCFVHFHDVIVCHVCIEYIALQIVELVSSTIFRSFNLHWKVKWAKFQFMQVKHSISEYSIENMKLIDSYSLPSNIWIDWLSINHNTTNELFGYLSCTVVILLSLAGNCESICVGIRILQRTYLKWERKTVKCD